MKKNYFPRIIILATLILFSVFNNVIAQRTPSLGSQQNFESDPTYWMRTDELDETHFITVYKSGSSPSASASDIYAVVGEVNTSTKSISYGTPTIIESSSANRPFVVGISGTQAVIGYELDIASDIGTARVLTISGTSITNIGGTYNFSAGDFTTAEGVSLGSGKFVIVYDDLESVAFGTVVAGDISGSTISFGTPAVFSSSHTDKPAVNALSSTKIIIGYEDDGATIDHGKVIIADVSGTSFTFGSSATFHSSSTSAAVKEVSVAPLSSGYFVVAYTEDNNSDRGKAIIGTYTGTTANFPGSSIEFDSSYYIADKDVEQLNGDEFIIVWNGTSTINPSKIITGVRNGNSITLGGTVQVHSAQGDDNRLAILNENSFVIGFTDDTGSPTDHGDAIVGTLPTPGLWTGSTSTDWATGTNWDDGNVPGASTNVSIPNVTNQPIISATTAAEVNNLTIQSGASLTIESTATNNGSLIVNGTSSGDVTYNRWVSGASSAPWNWHLISAPVAGQAINTDFMANNSVAVNATKYGLAPYNNSTPGWAHFTSATLPSTFGTGTGYEVARSSDGVISFTGTINTGDIEAAVTANASPGKKWNLVGNPFTAAIYANEPATNNVIDANSSLLDANGGLNKSIYVYDHTADGGNGDYITINNSSAQTYIAPGQAFFIYAGSAGNFDFTRAMQTHQTGDIFKSGEISFPEITLFVENQNSKKSTHIKYIDGMTTAIDPGYDAARFDAGDNSLAVFTQLVGDNASTAQLDIQCLPTNGFGYVIPVGLTSEEAGEVIFSIQTSQLPAGTPVYIEDKQTGNFTALHVTGSFYQATVAQGSKGFGRFYLHAKESQTGIKSNSMDIVILPQPKYNRLRIMGISTANSHLNLYDLSGRKLITQNLQNSEVSMEGIKTGVYVATIKSSGHTISKKISWVKN